MIKKINKLIGVLLSLLLLVSTAVVANAYNYAQQTASMVKNITVSGGTFTADFKPGNYIYSVYMETFKDTVSVKVTLNNDRFEYAVKGNAVLERSDNNTIYVRVTDPQGEYEDEVYTLNLFFEAIGFSYLDVENGVLSPQFDKFHTTYYATVGNNVDTFEAAGVNWKTVNRDDTVQMIEPTNLNPDGTLPEGQRCDYRFIVTEADGTSKTYKLCIFRKDSGTSALNSDALLETLTINGGLVDTSDFRQKKANYDFTVPDNITKLEIEAFPVDKSSTVNIVGDLVMSETEPTVVTIVVTSDKSGESSYYTLRCQYNSLMHTEKHTDLELISYAVASGVTCFVVGVATGLIKRRKKNVKQSQEVEQD